MDNITIDAIKSIIKNNSFMDLRKHLEKINNISSIDFDFSPVAHYTFINKNTNKKYIIANKNNVELDGSEYLI
jgi:hypothetical protein